MAHYSWDKLYPEVEDTLRRLLAMQKDDRPVDFEVFGGVKKTGNVHLAIKAKGPLLYIRVTNNGAAFSSKHSEMCMGRDVSYEEVLDVSNKLYDDVFPDGDEEVAADDE